MIALFECVEEQYDPANTCYGKGYICYNSWPEGTKSIPWRYMTDYMQSATESVPVSDGRLWIAQVKLFLMHNYLHII